MNGAHIFDIEELREDLLSSQAGDFFDLSFFLEVLPGGVDEISGESRRNNVDECNVFQPLWVSESEKGCGGVFSHPKKSAHLSDGLVALEKVFLFFEIKD